MNQIDLNNKTAIITGGAQGFGYSMVERFSQSGAKVVIWDKDQELIDSLDLPKNVIAVQTDVTSYDSVENSIKETLEKNNTIDILVNNAGIAGPSFKTWEYPIDQWQNVVDIDLTGVFYCCRAVTPHMIKNNYGRIVNIASIAGKEGNPNAMPYSAAKAGVIALTKSLGKELSDKNIAVNCVTPAAAKTRIFDQISQEHIDYMLSKIPRNRFLKVEELASLVAQQTKNFDGLMQWAEDAKAQPGDDNFGPLNDLKEKPHILNSALRTMCENDGIGSKVALQVRDGLLNRKELLLDLSKYLELLDEPKSTSEGALSGMTFCITGALSNPRKEIQQMVKNAGGKVVGSVSSNLDVLIAGENAGSKLAKAQNLGIQIWTETQLLDNFSETPVSIIDDETTEKNSTQSSLADYN